VSNRCKVNDGRWSMARGLAAGGKTPLTEASAPSGMKVEAHLIQAERLGLIDDSVLQRIKRHGRLDGEIVERASKLMEDLVRLMDYRSSNVFRQTWHWRQSAKSQNQFGENFKVVLEKVTFTGADDPNPSGERKLYLSAHRAIVGECFRAAHKVPDALGIMLSVIRESAMDSPEKVVHVGPVFHKAVTFGIILNPDLLRESTLQSDERRNQLIATIGFLGFDNAEVAKELVDNAYAEAKIRPDQDKSTLQERGEL